MKNDLEIYRSFLQLPRYASRSAFCKRQRISRDTLYKIIKRVRHGNRWKIRVCTLKGRLGCLWEYKYKLRYLALPRDRRPWVVRELRNIIKSMASDGFNQRQIALHLKKDRSTIIHHLDV